MQDVILFRDEPLERLAECGDVPWLPPLETVQSYRSLLNATIAPAAAPLPATPGSWAPLLLLATPSLATASASTRLQLEVFRKAFKPPKATHSDPRRLPLVSRVTHDIGGNVVKAVNATALQLRLGAQRRGENATRGLFKALKAEQADTAAGTVSTPSATSSLVPTPLPPRTRLCPMNNLPLLSRGDAEYLGTASLQPVLRSQRITTLHAWPGPSGAAGHSSPGTDARTGLP